MKTTISAIVLVGAALAGCATASKVALPGGGEGFAIKCPDPQQCYNKAAEVCAPGVYELAATNTHGTGVVINGSGSYGSETTLIVSCKANNSSPPPGK
jgi:hypothetical protein